MNIVFRVDATSQIGSGHFYRCLTLADALKQIGAEVSFVSRQLPEHLRTKLGANGHRLLSIDREAGVGDAGAPPFRNEWLGVSQEADARDTLEAISSNTVDWLIVDHYALDARWEGLVNAATNKLLVIDDLADRRHICDVLIDQNHYVDMEVRYEGKVPAHCRLLLGPRYAILRDEFRQLRRRVTPRDGSIRKILVFLGGGDAGAHVMTAIDALREIDFKNIGVDVVVGAQQSGLAHIRQLCSVSGFTCHVQTDRMAELMADADLAIGAGGSATWERACMGLPTLAIAIAENQVRVVEDAAAKGVVYAPQTTRLHSRFLARHLESLMENPQLLRMLSTNSLGSTDGRGVARILRSMGCSRIHIRKALQEDSRDIFLWRNHELVRGTSRNGEFIGWTEHQAWFRGVMEDSNRHLLIGEIDGRAVGVVRFDVNADEAEVSIYLVPADADRGTGSDLLSAAEIWLLARRSNVLRLKAEVLGENMPSHHLFQSLGYARRATMYLKQMERTLKPCI